MLLLFNSNLANYMNIYYHIGQLSAICLKFLRFYFVFNFNCCFYFFFLLLLLFILLFLFVLLLFRDFFRINCF